MVRTSKPNVWELEVVVDSERQAVAVAEAAAPERYDAQPCAGDRYQLSDEYTKTRKYYSRS